MVQNVTPEQSWAALRDDAQARLVDVRTDVEWNFVGLPDLSGLGKEVALIPWHVYPTMAINPGFIDDLNQRGLTPAHAVFFLCRSGVRSLSAAQLARERGFDRVFNIADGFEGPPDAALHRGVLAGWKAAGLPWRQR